jgi:hypothetical protein
MNLVGKRSSRALALMVRAASAAVANREKCVSFAFRRSFSIRGEINATPRGGRKTAQASHVAIWSVEAGDSGHSVGGATSLVMPEADYLARPAAPLCF